MEDDARKVPLGELAEIRLGQPFRGTIPEVAGGSVRVVQIKDLTPAGIKDRDALLRTELERRKNPDWLLDGDVLFVSRGSNPYAAPIKDPPARTVCSPHIYVIRVRKPGQLLPAFLAWQLNQTPAQRYLRQSAEGSHQLSIRRTVLDQMAIRIPPLERQHATLELERMATAEREILEGLIRSRRAELAAVADHLLKY